jgi:hypothetical protein
LLGHEQVTVPAGTFLTAKVQLDTTVRGTLELWVDVDDDGEDDRVLVRMTSVQNVQLWCDPDVGPVKMAMTLASSQSARGLGSSSVRGTAAMALADWGPR